MYVRRNKNKNHLLTKMEDAEKFLSRIHRARVTDVHVDKGTVDVDFEDTPYRTEVDFPLLGLSMPPKMSESDSNGGRSSWGRYIPQEGDVLIIGFTSNATPYAIGYSAVFYEGFNAKDIAAESRGGIGWGLTSAKRMKPGDWDFKSARRSGLYLGDKARLYSGPHSILVNKSTGDITTKSDLIYDQYGSSSESRRGSARRKIIPVDPSETSIYNLTLQVAQESTDVVYSGFPKLELTRRSMGDVVDESIFQVMPSTLGGTVIRMLKSVKDPTGFIDLYAEKVDDLGNYGVEAPTALMFQWLTPASTWSITNTATTITSTANFGVTSPTITLTAATSMILDSISIQLGGAVAVEPLVKGTTFKTALSAFLTAVQSATSAVGSAPQNAAALTAIGVAAVGLKSALDGILSTKVKTL
jgi:hypothetical protein